jgi:uncharacterized membrane protein
MKLCKPGFWALAAVLGFPGAALAQDNSGVTFSFTSIVVPDTEQTAIYGINNNGAMVGYYTDEAGATHGLLLVDGAVTTFDHPHGTYGTLAVNMNSAGTIVGLYQIDKELDNRGFVYQNGQFTDIGPKGCIEQAGVGINDSGQIVGWCNRGGVLHGFLWDGKKYTLLDYPEATGFTLAWGINNAGLITLTWIDSNGNYEGATYNSATQEYSAPINVPGAVWTLPTSINSAGDMVFTCYDSSGNSYGALLIAGEFHTFSDPNGPDFTRAAGINDKNDIVGWYEESGAKFVKGFKANFKTQTDAASLRRRGNSSHEQEGGNNILGKTIGGCIFQLDKDN